MGAYTMKNFPWHIVFLVIAISINSAVVLHHKLTHVRPHHHIEAKPAEQTLPERCKKYYNQTPSQHREWAECMGVGYVDSRDI